MTTDTFALLSHKLTWRAERQHSTWRATGFWIQAGNHHWVRTSLRHHLLTNNCEHSCESCVRGEHRSSEVDEGVTRTLLVPLSNP
jgi:hypothetical protein